MIKLHKIVKTLFRTLENEQKHTRKLYSTRTTELGVRAKEAAFELGAVPKHHHPPLPSIFLEIYRIHPFDDIQC